MYLALLSAFVWVVNLTGMQITILYDAKKNKRWDLTDLLVLVMRRHRPYFKSP